MAYMFVFYLSGVWGSLISACEILQDLQCVFRLALLLLPTLSNGTFSRRFGKILIVICEHAWNEISRATHFLPSKSFGALLFLLGRDTSPLLTS